MPLSNVIRSFYIVYYCRIREFINKFFKLGEFIHLVIYFADRVECLEELKKIIICLAVWSFYVRYPTTFR